jgi:hypothetical protein
MIDRLIFLRMSEDRGVELYGQLQALLNGENTYKRLHYLYGLAPRGTTRASSTLARRRTGPKRQMN